MRCLLAIARGAELTEQLTTLAKTGLCALTEEAVSYTHLLRRLRQRLLCHGDPAGQQFGDAGAHRPDERRRLAGRRGERDVYKRQVKARDKVAARVCEVAKEIEAELIVMACR